METEDAGGGAPSTPSQPLNQVRGTRRASEPGAPQCTKESCTEEDGNKNKLKCDKCDKIFHFRCTGLPTFQIHHFLTKGYRKFVCDSCTKVPENLKAVIPTPPPPNPAKQVLDLEKTVKEKQMEIEALSETNRMLQAKIKELDSSQMKLHNNYEKEKSKHSKLQAEAQVLASDIESYKNQIASHNTEKENTSDAKAEIN